MIVFSTAILLIDMIASYYLLFFPHTCWTVAVLIMDMLKW